MANGPLITNMSLTIDYQAHITHSVAISRINHGVYTILAPCLLNTVCPLSTKPTPINKGSRQGHEMNMVMITVYLRIPLPFYIITARWIAKRELCTLDTSAHSHFEPLALAEQ
jgi:hypothetical protein